MVIDYDRLYPWQDLTFTHAQVGHDQAANWSIGQFRAQRVRPGVLASSQNPDLERSIPPAEGSCQQGARREAIRIVVPEDQYRSIKIEPAKGCDEGLLNSRI